MDKDEESDQKQIKDLENIIWVEEEQSMRGWAKKSGVPVERNYATYSEFHTAILENGPICITTSKVDVNFFALNGRFDGHLMALRQSGLNIRRFLIRGDLFEAQYGDFQQCVDQIMSNNAVDCELETQHLEDLGEKHGFVSGKFDLDREYDRVEIDLIAALQLISIFEESFDYEDQFSAFELGFCVGRLFSSIQATVTLEPDAMKANEYAESYKNRGKMGKSKARKDQRLDHLFDHLKQLVKANPAFSRLKPIEAAKIALADASKAEPKLWTQGKGQLEMYLSQYASLDQFKDEYRMLFPKTG